MGLEASIRNKIQSNLAPVTFELINESAKHQGHSHYDLEEDHPEGNETHFRMKVVSEKFAGKSRIDRHRIVNELLADEFNAGLHALTMKLLAPGE